MTSLETVILTCRECAFFSQLSDTVKQSQLLTEADRKLFEDMWAAAVDIENWRQYDLILGCKNTQHRLREEFGFTDEAIAIFVRFASYDWR